MSMTTTHLGLLSALLTARPAIGQDLVGGGGWHSTKAGGVRGKWNAALVEDGRGAVHGTLTIEGSNVFSGGRVEGSLSQDQVLLGVFQEGAKVASFAGKITSGAVAGEWEASAVGDEGVWEGKLSGKPE